MCIFARCPNDICHSMANEGSIGGLQMVANCELFKKSIDPTRLIGLAKVIAID